MANRLGPALKAFFLQKENFIVNLLTLVSGSILANLIIIGASPILTRFYTPGAFGLYGLFISITTMISNIATLRYNLAIMLPEKDSEAANILALSLIIITVMSTICLLVAAFTHQGIAELLKNPDISSWLLWAPLAIFLISFFNTLNFWNTRRKKFKQMAISKTGRSLGVVGAQLASGLSVFTASSGLIGGYMLGQAVGLGIIVKQIGVAEGKAIWSNLSPKVIFAQAKRHKKFPLLTLWATLFNNLANQAPIWFIAAIYGTQTAGFFSVADRSIALPLSFISMSVSQVFYQRASELKKLTGSSYFLAKKVVLALILIPALPLLSIIFWGPEIFALVFGEQWLSAGKFAAILAPIYWSSFLINSLTMINIVHEYQEVGLFWQVGLLSLTIGIFYLGYNFQLQIYTLLFYYSMIMLLWYILNIFVLLHISKGKPLFKR